MTKRGERLMAIAHRAGNSVAGMQEALAAGVDLVEADVHAYRGRLEVRHLKTMGGLPYLWDDGELLRRRGYQVVELADLLNALDGGARLMVDLKGVHPRVAPMAAQVLRDRSPGRAITVCTQHWWMLDEFGLPVRGVLSAGSRTGLDRLRRRLARRPAYGVSVRRDLLTRGVVTELQRTTDVVMTWPVDTAEQLAGARRLGVDGVIGRNLDLLRRVLAEQG